MSAAETPQPRGAVDRSNRSSAPSVRRAVRDLRALDADTAEYLNALAFVLMRVAEADLTVCDDETRCMEEILVEHAGISADQAVLVVEIARHRCRIADCGTSYGVSKGLRPTIDPRRESLLASFLSAVAGADGEMLPEEKKAISQISAELGLDPSRALCDA